MHLGGRQAPDERRRMTPALRDAADQLLLVLGIAGVVATTLFAAGLAIAAAAIRYRQEVDRAIRTRRAHAAGLEVSAITAPVSSRRQRSDGVRVGAGS
jgi:hypothetical protein